MDGFCQKWLYYWLLSKFKAKFLQNYRVHVFNHCLNHHFSASRQLFDCPALCFVPKNGSLIHWMQICENSLYKHTLFLFQNKLDNFFYHGLNQQFSINKTSFIAFFPWKYPCLVNFETNLAKMRKLSNFSGTRKLTFSKTSDCFSFIKISVDCYYLKKHTRRSIAVFGSSQLILDWRKTPEFASSHD